MPLCTITGTVYLPSGAPAVSRVLTFRRADQRISGDLLPEDTHARTTAAGVLNVTLIDGAYTVFSQEFAAGMVVPSLPTASFADTVDPFNLGNTPDVEIVTALPTSPDPQTFYVIPL